MILQFAFSFIPS